MNYTIKKMPMEQNNYFIVKFNDQQELAAFIAAFSRFLNYPRGTIYMESPNTVEVWVKTNSCELVINENAKDAIIKEFGQFQYSHLSATNFSDQEFKLLITGNQVASMGFTEAESILRKLGSTTNSGNNN